MNKLSRNVDANSRPRTALPFPSLGNAIYAIAEGLQTPLQRIRTRSFFANCA